MLFNSFEFICLLLTTFFLYYLPAIQKWQVFILIAAGIVFYGFFNPYLLLLLFASASISFVFTYLVIHNTGNKKKLFATIGVAINLGVLLFFKYSGFFADLFLSSDNDMRNFLVSIPLPIGISFYTFHGISLLVDAYRNDESQRWVPTFNYRNSILYTLFFPQLVAGPILRAKYFIPQIVSKQFNQINWAFCFRHLLIGYFLKMVIADNLKEQTAYLSEDYLITSMSSITNIILLIGYACQIFADFAGYSYIARGLAGLFGYTIILNFNYPYIAKSFATFWRRWNIALSQFMHQYLYIPLGGNKKGLWFTYRNIFITMALAGFWHGAALGYLIWGIYHALFLMLERPFRAIKLTTAGGMIKRLVVFFIVVFGWVFFVFPEPERLLLFLQAVQLNWQLPLHYAPIYFTCLYSLPILAFHIYGWRKENGKQPPPVFKQVVFAIMLFMIIVNSGSAGSFIYFQF
ncbi:MAG TPA: MBOAT family O-acyltransferase [Chitinophagales bacterium]|nr:MBOAT family O-acyltransferase [Chitinophagales bacterium]